MAVLEVFGFYSTFRDWIASTFKSARMSILLNDSPEGFFSCNHSSKHGDPLSPFLLCLVEDILSRYISRLVEEGSITRISSPRGFFSFFSFVYC